MAHYPHRIRLRGPWECAPLAAQGGSVLPAGRRVTMPANWAAAGLASFVGRARFTRRFGYPGRIDDDERVWLVCDGLNGSADVALNDVELQSGRSGPFAFDVTRLLGQRNRLEVIIDGAGADAGLWGEVAMEVRRTAYLEQMGIARREGGVEVTGRVTGTCDGPLEIYVLADDRHVHYQTIEAAESGTPLRLTIGENDAPLSRVRVELINVATIWYAWEATLAPSVRPR